MNEARAPDFFSANAARYDRSRPALISDSTRDAMVRAARLPAGGRLLDVAAGTGRVAVPLAAAGYRVIAVDRSKDMLDVLRAKEATRRIDAAVASGGIPAIPRPNVRRGGDCATALLDARLATDSC